MRTRCLENDILQQTRTRSLGHADPRSLLVITHRSYRSYRSSRIRNVTRVGYHLGLLPRYISEPIGGMGRKRRKMTPLWSRGRLGIREQHTPWTDLIQIKYTTIPVRVGKVHDGPIVSVLYFKIRQQKKKINVLKKFEKKI